MSAKSRRLTLFASLMLIGTLAGAADDPLAPLKKGQPEGVARLIERLVGCNHWAGEEPYDAERKKEIAAAMKALRCDAVDKDEATALKRYAGNPAALKSLRKAREWNY